MPSNPNLTLQRFNEVAATACAEQTLKQLHQMACAPSTKLYQRQREDRATLWRQLVEVAETQALALSAPQPKPKVRASNKSVVTLPPPAPVDEAAVKE